MIEEAIKDAFKFVIIGQKIKRQYGADEFNRTIKNQDLWKLWERAQKEVEIEFLKRSKAN